MGTALGGVFTGQLRSSSRWIGVGWLRACGRATVLRFERERRSPPIRTRVIRGNCCNQPAAANSDANFHIICRRIPVPCSWFEHSRSPNNFSRHTGRSRRHTKLRPVAKPARVFGSVGLTKMDPFSILILSHTHTFRTYLNTTGTQTGQRVGRTNPLDRGWVCCLECGKTRECPTFHTPLAQHTSLSLQPTSDKQTISKSYASPSAEQHESKTQSQP